MQLFCFFLQLLTCPTDDIVQKLSIEVSKRTSEWNTENEVSIVTIKRILRRYNLFERRSA